MKTTYEDFVKVVIGIMVILMAAFYEAWSLGMILVSHMYYEGIMGCIGSIAIMELSFKTLMVSLKKALQNEEES